MDGQSRNDFNEEEGDQQQQGQPDPPEPRTSPTAGTSSSQSTRKIPKSVSDLLKTPARTLARKHTYDEEDGRTLVEHILFRALAAKNPTAVKELIEKYRDHLHLNRRGHAGHDILTGAVLTGDIGIFREVFKIENVDPLDGEDAFLTAVKDALLMAVKENQMEMVKELVRIQESKAGAANPTQSTISPTESTSSRTGKWVFENGEFTHSITPFMMAAKHGHYELLKYFYDRGERMPEVHVPSCDCVVCKEAARTLRKTEKRLQTLEAMANPTYMIFLAEHDSEFEPVYQSFVTAEKIKTCIYEEPGFKERYEKLLEKFQQLPIDLIDLCRSAEEVDTFLKQRQGYDHSALFQHPYPRLAYAIDMDHRNFVANPNVQFMIQSEFKKDTWNWSATSTCFGKGYPEWLLISLIVILYPFLNIFMLLAGCCCRNADFVKHLFSPINRCWSKFGSYLYFSGLLLYLNIWARPEGDISLHICCCRGFVVAFVFSHALQLGHQVAINPRHFYKRGWNWYDFFNLILFLVTFVFWGLGFESHFIRIPLPHSQLPQSDWMLLAECSFAIASTMASLRLIRWIILVPDIGPLQTSMGRMAWNLIVILIFLGWTIVTFSFGTNLLYRPYRNVTNAAGNKQPDHITDVFHQVWTFFKVEKIGLNQMYLYPHRVPNSTAGEGKFDEYPAKTTNYFIYGICVVFNIVALTFLRGTVIGLFGSSHVAVMKAKNIEWKYLRTQEWLYYIQDMMLAPPFNLLPHRDCIARIIARIVCRKKPGTSSTDVEASPLRTSKRLKKEYAPLLRNLLQRYFQKLAQEKEDKEKNKMDAKKK